MFHVKHGFRLHLVTELAFRLRLVGLRCAIEGTIQRVTSPPKLLPAAAPRQHEELRRLIHIQFDAPRFQSWAAPEAVLSHPPTQRVTHCCGGAA